MAGLKFVHWFTSREDYDLVRKLVGEVKGLPPSFDQWHEEASKLVENLEKGGFVVRKAVMDAGEFTTWCKENGFDDYKAGYYAFVVDRYLKGDLRTT
jgi:hypothetical protein